MGTMKDEAGMVEWMKMWSAGQRLTAGSACRPFGTSSNAPGSRAFLRLPGLRSKAGLPSLGQSIQHVAVGQLLPHLVAFCRAFFCGSDSGREKTPTTKN